MQIGRMHGPDARAGCRGLDRDEGLAVQGGVQGGLGL